MAPPAVVVGEEQVSCLVLQYSTLQSLSLAGHTRGRPSALTWPIWCHTRSHRVGTTATSRSCFQAAHSTPPRTPARWWHWQLAPA